jgi:hypothetical protein
MATIITVHGTFAHVENDPAQAAADPVELQWWRHGSAFDGDMKRLVAAESGNVEVRPFEWSGGNSEVERRNAGKQLLKLLREQEAKGEPYVLVGHSHGGSVISSALLESAGRRQPLNGLKRWITVGTPFVAMRKERFLFTRLSLMRKVVFVGSMMLFLMFLVYAAAEFTSGSGRGSRLFGATFPGIVAAMGLMMSLPVIAFYFLLRALDRRGLLHYSDRVKGRAREFFGARWLSLTHADDEAVQGLAFLPGAKLLFFDNSFAVSAITLLSVLALPLIYLFLLTSPPAMVGLADALKTRVYEAASSPEAEKAIIEARQRPGAASATIAPANEGERPRAYRWAAWRDYAARRPALEARFPNLRSAERALRFKSRFFEKNGKPCEGGRLCGGGADLRVNSGLLLHVVTDEVSWTLGAESAIGRLAGENSRWVRWLGPLVVAAVLVPLAFGLVALLLMLVIRAIAGLVSRALSTVLNRLTNAEVKRAAFGNDTEGEIAVGAVDRPVWLDKSPPRLPLTLGELISEFSNTMATRSITKFRHAIGRLALAEPKHTADTAITTYFTWKELVHSSYFDVAQFRKLVAQAVARSEGFAPTAELKADADFTTTAQWLAEIEGRAGASEPPGVKPPTTKDAGAVSAVVASTVKAEP